MSLENTFKLTYKEVPANPTLEFAQEMVKNAKGATKVESTGGGSTIDVGKYVAYKLGLPHKAIPTTAGTGSEVTKFAVLTVSGKKFSLEDNKLIPTEYELRPELITSLPAEHTIASGLDALCHAVESWWSPRATRESKLYAKKAIHGITGNLYESVKNPDNEFLRMKMLESANDAGRAFNITKTSICHAISYPLTIKYGIPHGIACAMTLPTFMNHFKVGYKMTNKVDRLIKTLGVKKIAMTDEIIDEALTSERATNTPIPITKEILQRLL